MKIARLITFANMCIEDTHQRDEFKDRILKYLSDKDPEILSRLLAGDY